MTQELYRVVDTAVVGRRDKVVVYTNDRAESVAVARVLNAYEAARVALADLVSAEGLPKGSTNRKVLIQAAREALQQCKAYID